MTQRVVNYTYGTGNPVLPNGSVDVRDGIDNLQSFDVFMNADEDTYNQRDGGIVQTISGAIRSVGFKPGSGDFTTGFTVQYGQRDYAWYDPVSKNWYSWLGTIPTSGYEVTPGTNPVGNANWKPVTDQLLRYDLASVNGAGLVGTKSGTTVEKVLASDTTLPDVGIFEGAGDNSAAITALASNSNLAMPVHGELRTINSASFSGIEHLVATKVLSGGVARVPGISPELLGGKYSVTYNGGRQLAALNVALTDPKMQDFGITFIGDSITWGVGSTGQISSGPARDGTLSDYRNNASSCSYVNELRRWIKRSLGINTTEVLSNHPYALGAGGESISTFTKPEYAFPKGADYPFTKTGTATDEIKESLTGPLLNAQRRITVNNGGTGSVSFSMTGSEFTLIFGGIPTGASYQVIVNGTVIGTFSSRVGDDGIVFANNQRRKHAFGYVKNGNITIKVIQYGAEIVNNSLYIEGILFERVIRVSNQGISGATSSSYLGYNFPESVLSGVIEKLSQQTSWNEARTGVGATDLIVKEAPYSTTGEQRQYSYLINSSWDITFTIPAGNDRLIIGYSSLANTGAIDVYADSVLITRVHTSDLYPGNTTGYAKSTEVTIPNTVTSIKLTFIYEMLGSGNTNYIYLEGIGYRNSANPTYPENNGFGDGVCLGNKDSFALIQLGVNDRANPRVKAPDEIIFNLEKALGLLPHGCSPILMVSPPAITQVAHLFDTLQVRNAVAKAAKRNMVDFIDNHSLFGSCPLKYFTTDNLHPNDIGHALIARNIANAIECAS